MDKQQQIAAARAKFLPLMDALAGADEPALTATGIGEWSVREMLAHITGWIVLDTEILRRLARGARPLPEGEERGSGETRNAGFAAHGRSLTGAEAIAELRAAFDACIAAAEALAEERFAEGRTASRIMRESVAAHLSEHGPEIAAFLVAR